MTHKYYNTQLVAFQYLCITMYFDKLTDIQLRILRLVKTVLKPQIFNETIFICSSQNNKQV